MEMHYCVAERNKKIRNFIEVHTMGLFEHNKTLSLMKEVGFEAHFLANGLSDWGLFVGIKR